LHGTLKDRLKPTRGLKGEETVRTLSEGWAFHYNYLRKHQTLKKTPAQSSGIEIKSDWHELVKEAAKYNAINERKEFMNEKPMEIVMR